MGIARACKVLTGSSRNELRLYYAREKRGSLKGEHRIKQREGGEGGDVILFGSSRSDDEV